jgi:hypothetical protein
LFLLIIMKDINGLYNLMVSNSVAAGSTSSKKYKIQLFFNLFYTD